MAGRLVAPCCRITIILLTPGCNYWENFYALRLAPGLVDSMANLPLTLLSKFAEHMLALNATNSRMYVIIWTIIINLSNMYWAQLVILFLSPSSCEANSYALQFILAGKKDNSHLETESTSPGLSTLH